MPSAPFPAFVNPRSGSSGAAREALEKAGFDVRDCDPRLLADAVRDAITEGHRRIVVAGGDGTIGTAAGVIAGTPVELAVIPGGTLNHFAKDHAIPEDPAQAAALAAGSGRIEEVDVAVVNDRVFLNTSTVGAYIGMVRHRDVLERRVGYRLATLVAAVRTFFGMRAFDVELEAEGALRRYRTPVLFVGVGERELRIPILGGRVEGGQGALHLLVPREAGRRALLRVMVQAITLGTRAAAEGPELDSYLVDRCTVHLRRRGPVGLDGEIVRLDTPLQYRYRRGALRVVAGDSPAPSV